jgi:hypothetical protein
MSVRRLAAGGNHARADERRPVERLARRERQLLSRRERRSIGDVADVEVGQNADKPLLLLRPDLFSRDRFGLVPSSSVRSTRAPSTAALVGSTMVPDTLVATSWPADAPGTENSSASKNNVPCRMDGA